MARGYQAMKSLVVLGESAEVSQAKVLQLRRPRSVDRSAVLLRTVGLILWGLRRVQHGFSGPHCARKTVL